MAAHADGTDMETNPPRTGRTQEADKTETIERERAAPLLTSAGS